MPQGIFTVPVGAHIFLGLILRVIMFCADCPLCHGSCFSLNWDHCTRILVFEAKGSLSSESLSLGIHEFLVALKGNNFY